MDAERRRVVVTGIGVVTPVGIGLDEFWCAIQGGCSGIGPLTRFDGAGLRSNLAAEVRRFDIGDFVPARQARRLDRFSAFAVAAGVLAVRQAGFDPGDGALQRAAVAVGSALGGVAYGEAQHRQYLRGGMRAVEPALALAIFGGAAATNLALALDVHGPTFGNAASCASGLMAIGEACRLIQRGDVDLALAGGAEAPLAPLTYGAFSLIRAMSAGPGDPQRACRPFDAGRDGFVMGEGAAILVLESLTGARRRGREIYAEVAGFGTSNDAWHMAAPRPDGQDAAHAMQAALRDARLDPTELGYINAHAAGTPLGDVAEARAIRRALPATWPTTPVSSTKSLHGHALGATAAIEAALTVQALRTGWLPPTRNLDRVGDDCGLCHIPVGGIVSRPAGALCNAFGFGGINACLALRAAPRD